MHVNMKYYIVTMGGIFISLGVGMLVGFNLNYDQELSKQQAQIISDLDAKFEKLSDTNNELKAKLKELNLNHDKTLEFITSNIDKLIAGELEGNKIGIITINNDNPISYANDAVLKSNGEICFNINFTGKAMNEEILSKLSEIANSEIKDINGLIDYVLETLKGSDAKSKLAQIEELGLLEVKDISLEYNDYQSVVLSKDEASKESKDLAAAITNKLKESEKYVVDVNINDGNKATEKDSKENEVATVNNLNQSSGKLALVLLLKDRNVVGNFGVGEDCEGLIPYKK